jgi:hypothetical protein
MHPLMENTSHLKDSELETKIIDLSKKYFQASRNPALQQQVLVVLEFYKDELSIRRAKFWQEQNEKRDSDLDNLINVS